METMRERFAAVTARLLEEDGRTAVVLADIGVAAFAAALRRHPDRVVNVGIREQAMIGVAAGMALEGLRPIVHSYAPFLVERPFEQIKLDFGHQGLGAVLVSIGASYDAAAEGRTHQAPGDVALMASLPGWEIHVPGHPDEVEALVRRAVVGDGRSYVRLAADANQRPHPAGGWTVIRRGSTGAPTVVAVGPMLDRVLAATGERNVTVLYGSTVRPIDAAALRAAVSCDVVLVEPYLEGTSAAAVTAVLADRPSRLLSIGVPNTEHRRYGSRWDHDAAHGLDVAGLRDRIDGFVGRRAA